MEEVVEEVFQQIKPWFQSTSALPQLGLGCRPFVHELAVLAEHYEGLFGTPQFFWNCDGASSDLQVVNSERIRRYLGIDESFGFGSTGVGVMTLHFNDSLFLALVNSRKQYLIDRFTKEQVLDPKFWMQEDTLKIEFSLKLYGLPFSLAAKSCNIKNVFYSLA